MENTQIEIEQETQALSIYEQAAAVKVVDRETYDRAAGIANAIKDMTKQVVDYWKPIKAKAKAVHTELCAKENELLKPLKDAQTLIGNEQRKFLAAQEQIRQEQERKARAIADEAARKERAKLEAQAAKAAEKGKDEKAAELAARAQEVVAAPVFVAPVVDKNVRKDVAVRITDKRAFLTFVASEKFSPIDAIEIRESVLKSWVKNNQIMNGDVPGIEITKTLAPVNRA